jgi:hypothetical protein
MKQRGGGDQNLVAHLLHRNFVPVSGVEPDTIAHILQYALATLKKKSRMFDVNREFALDKSLTYGTCQFVFYPVGKNIKRE